MGADPFTGTMLGLSALTGVGSAVGRLFSGGSSSNYFFKPSVPPISAMLYESSSKFMLDTLGLNMVSLDQQRFLETKQLEEIEEQMNDVYLSDINVRVKQGLRDRAKVAVASAAANLSGNTANLLTLDSDMQTDLDNTITNVNFRRSQDELKDMEVASTLSYWAQENEVFDQFFKASTQSYMGVFSDILAYNGGEIVQLPSSGGDTTSSTLSSLSSLFGGLASASSAFSKLNLSSDTTPTSTTTTTLPSSQVNIDYKTHRSFNLPY